MLIKICGLTNTDDALHAVQAGASHLGIIFVSQSPRCVGPGQAKKRIVQAVQGKALCVGVFQNHSQEEITEVAVNTAIDIIQLHGDEDAAFCRSIALRTGKKLIKTIIVDINDPKTVCDKIASYSTDGDQVQLLRFLTEPKEMRMSTGFHSPDTNIHPGKSGTTLPPYFFTGGLATHNLKLVLEKIRPAGVDVASAVEASPGKKDPDKVSAFIAEARNQTATIGALRSNK